MFAVIRLRGSVGLKDEIEDTLNMLRLHRKMHCVLIKDTGSMKGMLQKSRNWITWGEIDDDTLRLMITKRGRKSKNDRLTDPEVDDVFKKAKENEKIPEGIDPVFRLSPPSRGFKKSIKQHYPDGELGYRGKEINELLKRMI